MRIRAVLAGVAACAGILACAPPPEVTGRALYQDFCVSCHGPSGRGGGPEAAERGLAVPDLTLISARNGGRFPMAGVMSTIDGYTRRRAGPIVMPEFGVALQEGPLVLVDTGDGIVTPTPERLVALAEYLRSIQR